MDNSLSHRVHEDRARPSCDAVGSGNSRVVETLAALIEAGADLRAMDENGKTPFHSAASEGREDALQILLAQGVDLEEKAHDGWTALHYASWFGSVGCVSLLLDAGANLNPVAISLHHTPLHLAAWNGHLPCVQLLVEKGADLNARTRRRRTPLAVARIRSTTYEYLRSVGGTM